MNDCTLVTCAAVPTLDPDDRLLMGELERRGIVASVETWNDPRVDWASSKLCLVRSAWDYHHWPAEFDRWLDHVDSVTYVQNGTALLRWNAHKSYLRDLQARGVPVVPTAWVSRGETAGLADLCERRGWSDVVIKPARGAATHGVMLVACDPGSRARGQTHLDHLATSQDALIQPYLPSVVSYGERALIFFDGRYSHAVVKKPFDAVLAVRSAFTACARPTNDEMEVALAALAAAPKPALYARVDLLRDEQDNARVSELELIEPALYFGTHPPARVLLADAIEHQLDALAGWAAS